jgi:nitrogenase subunit NifH
MRTLPLNEIAFGLIPGQTYTLEDETGRFCCSAFIGYELDNYTINAVFTNNIDFIVYDIYNDVYGGLFTHPTKIGKLTTDT